MQLVRPSLGQIMDWERFLARAVSGIWALFWLWFGIASGIGEGLALPGVLLHAALPGAFFLGITAFAWWKERAGSYVFLFAGLFIYGAYWSMRGYHGLSHFLQVGALLALPALVAGLLFYEASRPHGEREP